MNFIAPNVLVLFPTKCYTTSIKAFFSSISDICLVHPHYGKHIELVHAIEVLNRCLGYIPLDLKLIVPIRDPRERALSTYRSHLKDAFDGMAVSAKGLEIEEYFATKFGDLGFGRSELTAYFDTDKYDCSFIHADEQGLSDSVTNICKKFGLPLEASWIEKLNPSPNLPASISEERLEAICEMYYPESLKFYKTFSSSGYVVPSPYRR